MRHRRKLLKPWTAPIWGESLNMEYVAQLFGPALQQLWLLYAMLDIQSMNDNLHHLTIFCTILLFCYPLISLLDLIWTFFHCHTARWWTGPYLLNMQLMKMVILQSGVAEAWVQVVMEVEEEVQQGVALIIVGHRALLVVVAVTTGKSCKFSLDEWLPTIDTLRMDVWCCFEWMYSIPNGANDNSWAFPFKFPLHMGYRALLWVTNDCLLGVKSLIPCNFSVLWMPISNLGFALLQPITTPMLSEPLSWLPSLQWPLTARATFCLLEFFLPCFQLKHKDKNNNWSVNVMQWPVW